MLKRLFFAIVGFVGWMLSPFTWWNDTFVNLPLAYIAASAITKLAPHSFLPAFLISYWVTNLLGIVLMYIGAQNLASKELVKKKRQTILITILFYSIISAFLIGLKVIRPF